MPVSRVKFLLLVLLISAMSLLIFSCRGKSVLFLTDPYWAAAGFEGGDTAEEKRWIDIFPGGRSGAVIQQMEVDEFSAENVQKEAEKARVAAVLLSPLLSAQVESGFSAGPGIELYLLSYNGQPDPPPPFPVIELTRKQAFFDLGKEICAYVQVNEGAKVRGMWYTGSDRHREEYDAFVEGFAALCGGREGDLDISFVETLNNEQGIKDYIQGFEHGDKDIGISFLANMNEYCINKFLHTGMAFAGEYMNPDAYDQEREIFSVRYSLSPVFELLQTDGIDEEGIFTVEAVLVRGR